MRDRLRREPGGAARRADATKRETLASIQADEQEFLHEVAGLERVERGSSRSQIRAAQARCRARRPSAPHTPRSASPSASGFIWPVSGPVTSGFGWRWGRMHEGIDIAVPARARRSSPPASGTVIYAGWMGGYGNLVVIDHGGGLATAYGHQSAIARRRRPGGRAGPDRSGTSAAPGTASAPTCTSRCASTASAVDPLGYL